MLADFPRELVFDAKQLGYHEKLTRQICTYRGCNEPPLEDSNECAKHTPKSRHRKRRWWRKRAARLKAERKRLKKQRKMFAKRKRCLVCGAKRVKGQEHCVKHAVRIGDLDKLALDKPLDNKAARIAAHTSIDADGRSRFRGQGKRGQPKRGAIDAKDLSYALDALGRGIKGLAFAEALIAQPFTKAESKEAESEALAQLHQAKGFVEDVLKRHRFRLIETDPADKPNRR